MVKSLLQTSQDVQVLLPSSPVTASHIETSMNHTLQRASQEREEHNRIHTQTEPDDHQKTS